jgi:hypothetical protein
MQTSLHCRRSAIALAIALALGIVACRTAPVLTPRVTLPSNEKRTDTDVANAIKTAGLRYEWEMVDDGPGHMTGTLHLRTHTAVVSIPYDANSYAIEYQDSERLRYENGRIHRNYNRWVNNLSQEIRQQLGF